jgi:hypothetical protein
MSELPGTFRSRQELASKGLVRYNADFDLDTPTVKGIAATVDEGERVASYALLHLESADSLRLIHRTSESLSAGDEEDLWRISHDPGP